MTGKINLKGRTSIALVSRAQLIRAALEEPEAELRLAEGDGTSHSGVTRERPERRRRKVIPRLVDLN